MKIFPSLEERRDADIEVFAVKLKGYEQPVPKPQFGNG
jgi:hypothetical protein